MSRADVCVLACAELFRGDGEIMASPMGIIPALGARLARATFAPDLLLTDGVASLVNADGVVEGWMPYSRVFDQLWNGRRHVVMGASQLDRFGNQNLSCIGPWEKPGTMLIGARGAPGNTVNHATSYWLPKQSARLLVERVDFVSGVGNDRAAGQLFHDLRGVVSDLGVFDFGGQDGAIRLVSIHPGVSVESVRAATGFVLEVADNLVETPEPTAEQQAIIERLDPQNTRSRELA